MIFLEFIIGQIKVEFTMFSYIFIALSLFCIVISSLLTFFSYKIKKSVLAQKNIVSYHYGSFYLFFYTSAIFIFIVSAFLSLDYSNDPDNVLCITSICFLIGGILVVILMLFITPVVYIQDGYLISRNLFSKKTVNLKEEFTCDKARVHSCLRTKIYQNKVRIHLFVENELLNKQMVKTFSETLEKYIEYHELKDKLENIEMSD